MSNPQKQQSPDRGPGFAAKKYDWSGNASFLPIQAPGVKAFAAMRDELAGAAMQSPCGYCRDLSLAVEACQVEIDGGQL